MAQRACDLCGRAYDAASPRSKYCTALCRRTATKRRARGEVMPLPAKAPLPPPSTVALPVTAEAVERMGATGTPLGMAAIALARRLDSSGPTEPGSSIAAVVRELRSTLAEIASRAIITSDPIDELQARRAKRLGAG